MTVPTWLLQRRYLSWMTQWNDLATFPNIDDIVADTWRLEAAIRCSE
jgi:hypothetical protein